MRTSDFFAIVGGLLNIAAALPMPDDNGVNTVTEIDTVVEMITATVWVDEAGSTVIPAEPTTSNVHSSPNTLANDVVGAVSSTTTTSSYAAPPSTASSSPPATTTSSTYVAPAPAATTSSVYVAPVPAAPIAPTPSTSSTTTTTPSTTAAPTTSIAVAATTSAATSAAVAAGGSAPSGQSYSNADLTYYDVGLGSCGMTNVSSQLVVAVAVGIMNKATMCGKMITIQYLTNTVQAQIVDTCPGCQGNSLDLSDSAWANVTAKTSADGRVHGATWWYS